MSHIKAHAVKPGLQRHPKIKNIIAVASGKGGVGKSTVAVNLALALQADNARVGLLDADIYGPSQACMLGIAQPTPSEDGKQFKPTEAYGLATISMAYLLPNEETPTIWRGPMVGRALEQLFFDTDWPELDYLVIDLPPGTGDVALTLVQKIPVTAAVMVTTPQTVAALDVRKAFNMFKKVAIPVIGVVENMAAHVCPSCGHHAAIFGEHSGDALAEHYQIPLLGRLVLDPALCETSETGKPWMAEKIPHANTDAFIQIAKQVADYIAALRIDYSAKMPHVVVE